MHLGLTDHDGRRLADGQPKGGGRRQQGLSLLEAVVFCVVLTMILQAMTSSTVMVSRASSFGRTRTTAMAKSEISVDRMVAEVRMSASGTDPQTGRPVMHVEDTQAGTELSFRRVLNFGQNASGQLELIWSTPIVYRVEGGILLRVQDGQESVMLRNVSNHEFAIDQLGRIRFEVEMEMPGADESVRRVSHTQVVQPMF